MNSDKRFASYGMVAAAFAMVTAFHCGPMSTGGARTSIQVAITGATPTGPTSLGWSVTYEQALVSADTIRFNVGEPVFEATARARSRRPLWQRLSIGTALAHPGHYSPGEALADASLARAVDLLGPRAEFAGITAVTGYANSATLTLRPADASRASGTALSVNSTVRVVATAARDGATVRFRMELPDAIDIAGSAAHGEITADGSTRFQLSVNLGLWLDRADFSTLSALAPGADGVIDVPASHQAHNALFRGVSNGAAYSYTLPPPSQR